MSFFFHISLKGGKNLKAPTTSFFMLKSKYVKSITIVAFSSIRLSKEVIISISSPNFRLMNIAKFNASPNKQQPLN